MLQDDAEFAKKINPYYAGIKVYVISEVCQQSMYSSIVEVKTNFSDVGCLLLGFC